MAKKPVGPAKESSSVVCNAKVAVPLPTMSKLKVPIKKASASTSKPPSNVENNSREGKPFWLML